MPQRRVAKKYKAKESVASEQRQKYASSRRFIDDEAVEDDEETEAEPEEHLDKSDDEPLPLRDVSLSKGSPPASQTRSLPYNGRGNNLTRRRLPVVDRATEREVAETASLRSPLVDSQMPSADGMFEGISDVDDEPIPPPKRFNQERKHAQVKPANLWEDPEDDENDAQTMDLDTTSSKNVERSQSTNLASRPVDSLSSTPLAARRVPQLRPHNQTLSTSRLVGPSYSYFGGSFTANCLS